MHQRLKIITLKSPQFNKKNVIQKFTLKFKVTIYKPVFFAVQVLLEKVIYSKQFYRNCTEESPSAMFSFRSMSG